MKQTCLLFAVAFAGSLFSPLEAQTFAPAPALSFTKGFGGANPLPQILTIASTSSTSIRFNAVATTTTGGAWLQISPQGTACCFTPEAITVTASPVVTLAAGSYSAQIVITEYTNAANTITVPVQLTVAAVNDPFFDNVPGQLSFPLKLGSTNNPPAQAIQIRNAGSGTLSWSASVSTADGGNWLSVSPGTGTAPGGVSASVTTQNLPGGGSVAGTFIGQVAFSSSGSSVTIPVSVAVGDSVFGQVNPINFTKPFGGANPLPQILTITSTGSTSIRFNATVATGTGGAWLQISPQGNACCFTPEAITVTVNAAAALAAGTYTAEIIFSEYSNNDLSMTVPVTLTVAPTGGPFFDNLPGQLSYTLQTGRTTNPAYQTVPIRNGGAGTLGWSAAKSTSDGGNWLSVSVASGTAPATVAVIVTTAALPGGGLVAGTYIGQVVFRSASGSVTIPVSVAVGDNVFGQVNPISFTKPFGGANSLPQVLTVTSTGATSLRFNAVAATAKGGSWLQISPQGTACCFTPEAITLRVSPSASLAAGTYTGQITFTEYSNNDLSITVPVTLTIGASSSPFFDNLPGQLSYSLKTGSSTNPPTQSIQIRNAGAGTLNWTAAKSTSDGGNWLSLSVTSGTAPATVGVRVITGALPNGGLIAGNYTGEVVFTGGVGSITIPINVAVGDSVFGQVNPIGFSKPFGGANPLPQVLSITSTGATSLRFNAVAATATGGNWLQISPQGAACCFTSEAITVSVNPAASLAAGTYTAEITITEYSNNDLSITVPVTLTVGALTAPFFDNVPGQLSFSLKTGTATNPPSQTVQIRNAGAGTLNWAASKSTSDGGNWLSVSPVNGTAPSIVTVSVITNNFPGSGLTPGTFTGQVAFLSAGGTVSIPVSVSVGDSVFSQMNPISFTMPAGGANPLPQILAITSTGSASIRFNAVASTATGGNWLTISPQGAACCFTPEAVTVSINPASPLATGTYTGEITFTEYSTNDLSITVPVTLTIEPSTVPFFDNLPGHLTFSLKTGSTTNPPFQLVQIRNAGTSTLNWAAATSTADGGDWLSVSLPSGAAPSTIAVGITTQALPNGGLVPGNFTGQVVFSTSGSSVTIPITVAAGDSVFGQVNPISFTKPFGGANPLPQILSMTSTGAESIRFNAVAVNANGGNWLQITPSGTACCFTPEAITVSVNADGALAPGTYTAEINIIEYSTNDRVLTVPVALTVAPTSGALFDNIPGQMGFSFQPSTSNPAPRSLQLRNVGAGTLTWSAGKSTADGGNWLSVSAATGAAPSIVTVGIMTQSLPGGGLIAGTYIGQVLFRSATGNVSVPVSVTVGATVFSQVAPLGFTTLSGINPASQMSNITSLGSSIRFNAVAASATGGNWLQISPEGAACCMTPAPITVTVNATGLAPGVYTGEVNLIEYSTNDLSMTVPVTVVVH